MTESAPFRVVVFVLLIAGLIILSSGIIGQLLKFGAMVAVAFTHQNTTNPAFPDENLFKHLDGIATKVFEGILAASSCEKPDVFATDAHMSKDPNAWQEFLAKIRNHFGRGGARFIDKESSYVQADGKAAHLVYRMVFEKNKKGKITINFVRTAGASVSDSTNANSAGHADIITNTNANINTNSTSNASDNANTKRNNIGVWRIYDIDLGTHITPMDKLEPLVNAATALCVLILVIFVTAKWMKTPVTTRTAFLKSMALYEALTVGVVVVLFPFFWMFCTSFKASGTELIFNEKNPFDFVANEPTIDNFRKVLKLEQTSSGVSNSEAAGSIDDAIERKNNFGTYFLNSLFVSTTAAFLVTLFSAMAAYVFSKKDLPYKNGLFSFLLGTMMIPGLMYMVPQFFMICKMGLCGTKLAMFLPHLASVFGVFLLKQYMDTIPSSLLEAARIDGASEWQCFTVIVIPLSMPIILTLFLLTFLFHWSNFLWQLIVTDFANPLSITLPVGLALFRGQYTSEIGQIMAASCFSIVPIAVLFLIAQKYFIEGMTQGAVKE